MLFFMLLDSRSRELGYEFGSQAPTGWPKIGVLGGEMAPNACSIQTTQDYAQRRDESEYSRPKGEPLPLIQAYPEAKSESNDTVRRRVRIFRKSFESDGHVFRAATHPNSG
jgi:hypothetical protein